MNNFWLDVKEAKTETVEQRIEKKVGNVIWLDDPYVGRDAPPLPTQMAEWDTSFEFDINACADGVSIPTGDWELDM